MRKILLVLFVFSTIFLLACSGGGSASLSKGEVASIKAAKEIEKVIMNPEYMQISKIYYKEGPDALDRPSETVRMTVKGVSQGGATVYSDFSVFINILGETVVSYKFTDLEIMAAGADGVYMKSMNELNFSVDESELENSWEKIDAAKIDKKFRE